MKTFHRIFITRYSIRSKTCARLEDLESSWKNRRKITRRINIVLEEYYLLYYRYIFFLISDAFR